MKLRICGFENDIVFDEKSVNILQIDSSKCFSNVIDILNQKINGIENNSMFLLDENDEEINMAKEMYVLFDLFNIEYNSKKILNKIYDIIAENIDNAQELKLDDFSIGLRNYIIQEINELPFEFVMKREISVQEILKLYDLRIDDINYSSVLERVELIVDIIATLKLARVLVIPNLKCYLSNEELVELYKYSLYNNINLLIVQTEDNEALQYEKVLKIDDTFDEVNV